VLVDRWQPLPVGHEGGRRDPDLRRNQRQHPRGNVREIGDRAAWESEHTELHREAKSIAAAPATIDQMQILGSEGIVAGQFAIGEIGGYLSEVGTLVVGEQVWGVGCHGAPSGE